MRLGASAQKPLGESLNLVGLLEAAHRFEREGVRTTGEVIGLLPFALDGGKPRRDWLRAGVGVEGQLAGGAAFLMLNATTQSPAPSVWLAAGWQKTL